MGKRIEKQYGKAVRRVMVTVNPIKKVIIKTKCTVHKYINIRALEIIKREGYEEQYRFFLKYIDQLNNGVMWADQDFKSTNHFYHYSEEKGLYGFSNALEECKKYYNTTLNYTKAGDFNQALFYFGAACHLIQDATVPQHVNNKLLKSHRKFELWIRDRLGEGHNFTVAKVSRRRESIEEYIKKNAVMANNTYIKYRNILDIETRYSRITNTIIVEAEKTTAGFMLDFYDELYVNNIND